jgi:hypothetical protein
VPVSEGFITPADLVKNDVEPLLELLHVLLGDGVVVQPRHQLLLTLQKSCAARVVLDPDVQLALGALRVKFRQLVVHDGLGTSQRIYLQPRLTLNDLLELLVQLQRCRLAARPQRFLGFLLPRLQLVLRGLVPDALEGVLQQSWVLPQLREVPYPRLLPGLQQLLLRCQLSVILLLEDLFLVETTVEGQVGVLRVWLLGGFDGVVFGSALGNQFDFRAVDLASIFKIPEEGVGVFAVGTCGALQELKGLAVGVDLYGATDALQLDVATSTRSIRLCT